MSKAIICDIDGTLAKMQGRSPYDYSKVYEDKVNTPILSLINAMDKAGYKILFVSGRPDSCKIDTRAWLLEKLGLLFLKRTELFMRKTGDKRCDSVIKKEIYDEIKKSYEIEFVLDDRKRVKRMFVEN
ncbi:MAG: hypothetical protein GY870_02035, partial [archaeon]|nr:hypothetical protein [archaeon]